MAAIQAALAASGAESGFPAAVLAETMQQDAALIHGIAAYRRHPWFRDRAFRDRAFRDGAFVDWADPPVIWEEGGSRLLDYGGDGLPVMVVPSLVNRAYVLDLMPDDSMLRWLAGNGVRPLLLDWGWPGEQERRFTLTDYVAGRLERALTAAARASGGNIALAGYCLGGTLAVAAAQRRPDLVNSLALLATPWDFHAPDAARARQAAACLPLIEPAMALTGALSADMVQTLFAMLDPWIVAHKYRGFATQPQDSARAQRFVALEDWLNDGIPLAAPVARACLSDWYGANTPARGEWRIAGQAVDPGAVLCRTFIAVPNRDRIVPPESARALLDRIAGAVLHEPLAGHIGMIAGTSARRQLWEPLRDWLLSR